MTEGILEPGMDRAQFLRRTATSGLVLAGATGGIFAAVEGVAWSQSTGDVQPLQAAYTAESLAVFVYGAAIKSKKFEGGSLSYLRAALANERAHRDFLGEALGSAKPTGLKFQIPSRFTKSSGTLLQLGETLEAAFVAAYLGAVETLDSNDLKVVAAKVAANEASHWGFFRSARKGPKAAAVPALPKSETIPNTVKALGPFLRD